MRASRTGFVTNVQSDNVPPPCPTLEELEEFVFSGQANVELEAHAAACPPCQSRVNEIRDNGQYLSDLLFQLQGSKTFEAQDTQVLEDTSGTREGRECLAGYTMLVEHHRGGQGIVYKATQVSTNRTVAIKMLRDGSGASAKARLRFQREVEILTQLKHSGIVPVYDSIDVGAGRLAIVMEFIDGVPLHQWSLPKDPRQRRTAILNLAIEICDAVHYAHLHGVIHRDLKPSNILIDQQNHPRIVDFGIAKALHEEGPQITGTNEGVFTLAYASPEQVSPSRHGTEDARTDIYSLGVILYEQLCGCLPHELQESWLDVARDIVERDPTRPSTIDSEIDRDLETIVLRALRKEPGHRYGSADALRQDIARYLAGMPIEARGDSTIYVLSKLAKRHRWAVLGVGVALSSAIGGVVGVQQYRLVSERESFERDKASAARQQVETYAEFFREITPHQPSVALQSPYVFVNDAFFVATVASDLGVISDVPTNAEAAIATIGEVLSGQGSSSWAAEWALRQACEQAFKLYGHVHPETARRQQTLAEYLYANGAVGEAQSLCERAIEALDRSGGEGNEFQVGRSRRLLAQMYLDQIVTPPQEEADTNRIWSLAEKLTRRSVQQLTVVDPSGLEVAASRELLAKILLKRGRVAEAVSEATESLKLVLRHYRDTNPATADALRMIAIYVKEVETLRADSPFASGRDASTGEVAAQRLVKIADGLQAITSAGDTSVVAHFGDGAPWEPLQELKRQLFGKNDREVAESLVIPAAFVFAPLVQGRAKGDDRKLRCAHGSSVLTEALPIIEAVHGRDSAASAHCHNQLFLSYWWSGEAVKAVEHFDQFVTTMRKLFRAEDRKVVAAYGGRLGQMYMKLADYSRAESVYLTSIDDLDNSAGAEDAIRERRSIAARLAEVYEKRGKVTEAETWRAQARPTDSEPASPKK